jgi:uncharacterized protein (DUF427 family)
MSVRLRDALMRELGALRHEPIDKRIRGLLGDVTVIDSTRALLVWEPRRVVPTYAFPVQDISAAGAGDHPQASVPAMGAPPQLAGVPVYDPSIPFAVRDTAGEALTIRAGDREAAAFRPADEDLAGHLIVDFDSFDAWLEEDEPNVAHPRDPFHRIDIVHSTRPVRVEHEGEVLAESSDPYMLFESPLPVRYYLPAQDVRAGLLEPSPTRSFCAYKGEASYLAPASGEDLAWTYPAPLREAAEVAGRVCFFNEFVDIVVDGTRLERPQTPWSRR